MHYLKLSVMDGYSLVVVVITFIFNYNLKSDQLVRTPICWVKLRWNLYYYILYFWYSLTSIQNSKPLANHVDLECRFIFCRPTMKKRRERRKEKKVTTALFCESTPSNRALRFDFNNRKACFTLYYCLLLYYLYIFVLFIFCFAK